MVSSEVIMFMGISALICFLLPVITFIYFKRKERISIKPALAGIAVFIVFALILEQMLHLVVLGNNLIANPIWYTAYAALAAGLFEEGGRFVAFKTFLKNKHEWKDGLAYGIGHGGIETIIIGAVSNIQYMVYSNLINTGLFDTLLVSKVPASQANQLQQLKEMLIQTHFSGSILGVAERIFAFGIQIALTMVVLYAVRYRKNIFLALAILLHALMDVPAALYQAKVINVYIAESTILIYFIITIIFLSKTRQVFSHEAANKEVRR